MLLTPPLDSTERSLHGRSRLTKYWPLFTLHYEITIRLEFTRVISTAPETKLVWFPPSIPEAIFCLHTPRAYTRTIYKVISPYVLIRPVSKKSLDSASRDEIPGIITGQHADFVKLLQFNASAVYYWKRHEFFPFYCYLTFSIIYF